MRQTKINIVSLSLSETSIAERDPFLVFHVDLSRLNFRTVPSIHLVSVEFSRNVPSIECQRRVEVCLYDRAFAVYEFI